MLLDSATIQFIIVAIMNKNHFPVLILIGRPASGKSEILHYLAELPPEERANRYHLGKLDVLDDFPMLWVWFEEDFILSGQLGQPRLHTTEDGFFKYDYLWHLLIRRLSLEYDKRRRDDSRYHEGTTTVIEFSRGGAHGGYAQAFQHLSDRYGRTAGATTQNVLIVFWATVCRMIRCGVCICMMILAN